MTAEHRINWAIRRSLAERCYLEWKAAPADDATSREIYSVHCSCAATGAITRLRHHPTIRVISWTPDAIALRDRAACPAVAKALADEFPSALEAQTIESLPVAEQQRLAAEYRQTLVEEAARAVADPPPINCYALERALALGFCAIAELEADLEKELRCVRGDPRCAAVVSAVRLRADKDGGHGA